MSGEPIYLQVCAGLCNRLRALVSGICWAEDFGRPLIIYWFSGNIDCPARFDVLFDKDSLPSWVTVKDENLIGGKKCFQPVDFRYTKTDPIKIYSHGHFHDSDKERWLTHLRRFQPISFLKERIVFSTNSIAVHIRRGDNKKAREVSTTELFLEAMKRETLAFVVATDCEETRRLLEETFPGRCTFPARTLTRTLEVGIQEAVVDFFSITQCSKLLGSANSSFTDCAAMYGNSELKIIMGLKDSSRCYNIHSIEHIK